MTNLQHRLTRHPVAAVTFITAISLLFVLGLPSAFEPDSGLRTGMKMLTRLGASALFIVVVVRLGWADLSGMTSVRIRPRWLLAMLPMLLIVGINLLGANWAEIVFRPTETLLWLGYNLSVGLFEETLLRGLCLTLLMVAWRDRKSGLMKAALTQAVIFGLLHLINLVHAPVVDTVAQTFYATLLGIGFAGLVAYTGSIWPGIVLHVLINLAGSMNLDLVPGAVNTPGNVGSYLVAIAVITLAAAVPGTLQVRRAMQKAAA